jgi:hypothetical protein
MKCTSLHFRLREASNNSAPETAILNRPDSRILKIAIFEPCRGLEEAARSEANETINRILRDLDIGYQHKTVAMVG